MTDLTRALIADAQNPARGQLEQILKERMAALTAGVEQAVAESLLGARREISDRLNQSARRLRSFASTGQWSTGLPESTQWFGERAVLFTLNRATPHLQALRHVAAAALPADTPLHSAS